MLKGFKECILRGNVVDLAIAVVISLPSRRGDRLSSARSSPPVINAIPGRPPAALVSRCGRGQLPDPKPAEYDLSRPLGDHHRDHRLQSSRAGGCVRHLRSPMNKLAEPQRGQEAATREQERLTCSARGDPRPAAGPAPSLIRPGRISGPAVCGGRSRRYHSSSRSEIDHPSLVTILERGFSNPEGSGAPGASGGTFCLVGGGSGSPR